MTSLIGDISLREAALIAALIAALGYLVVFLFGLAMYVARS